MRRRDFGTGSSHIREKDGLWAVLFWLNVIAVRNESLEAITRAHWAHFGRNVYSRHDFEAIPTEAANGVMKHLKDSFAALPGQTFGRYTVDFCDDFSYSDPVISSSAPAGPARHLHRRLAHRLPPVRHRHRGRDPAQIYLDASDPDVHHHLDAQAALSELIGIAGKLSELVARTGTAPSPPTTSRSARQACIDAVEQAFDARLRA